MIGLTESVWLSLRSAIVGAALVAVTYLLVRAARSQSKATKAGVKAADKYAQAASKIAGELKRAGDIQESQGERPRLVLIEQARFSKTLNRKPMAPFELPMLQALFRNSSHTKTVVVHPPVSEDADAVVACRSARVIFDNWQPGSGKDRDRLPLTTNPDTMVVGPGEFLHVRIILKLEVGRMETGRVKVRLKCDPPLADEPDLVLDAPLLVQE